MDGKWRKREWVEARHIAMYMIKKFTTLSLKKIGMYFGGRDHSTVLNAIEMVNDHYDTEKNYRKKIDEYCVIFENYKYSFDSPQPNQG